MKTHLNPALEVFGVVMTMYDSRTQLAQQVVDEVRDFFEDKVFDTLIPRTVRLSEAPSFGQPVTLYDPIGQGRGAYRNLAKEVVGPCLSRRARARPVRADPERAQAGRRARQHELPIDTIAPNPNQPRTEIDDERIAELADSIRKVGILQPIIVRPHGEGYQIIAGERRWRAAKAAGLEKVPVRVIGDDETESLELALIENLQRQDLNAIEEARGYRRLLTEYQMTQAELADKVSQVALGRHEHAAAARPARRGAGVALRGQADRRSRAGGPRRAGRRGSGRRWRRRSSTRVCRCARPRTSRGCSRQGRRSGRQRAGRRSRSRSSRASCGGCWARTCGCGRPPKKGKIEIDFHGEDDLERIFRLLAGGEAMREGERLRRGYLEDLSSGCSSGSASA